MDKSSAPVAPSKSIESSAMGTMDPIDTKGADQDATILESIGYKQELERSIGFASILAAGWNACTSWVGIAATLITGITQGGTVTVLYGQLAILFIFGCTALSIAELASSIPTAGGQYHYASVLAPKKYSRAISYATGYANMLAWIVTIASVTLTIPQQIIAIVANFSTTYEFQRWHIFLGYEAANIVILVFNIYGLQRSMSVVHKAGFVLSITLFFVVIIVCPARASPKQNNTFVWATFTNDSGWSSAGMVFLTGLINPNYMYVGLDCVIHMAEDCANAAVAVPRAIFSVIIIGFCTAFPFTIAMFYCLSDFDSVLNTKTGVPLYELFIQATRSQAGGTVLMASILCIQFFATNACQQTTGRLTWSLGRDNAFLYSGRLGSIHPGLGVPVWALIFNAVIVGVIGVLYVASTTAFNAIIGTCLILVQGAYAIPVAILMLNGRKGLVPHRSVRLGWVGWVANTVTVLWGIENLVIYCFPFVMPVTSSNMNYTVVVLAVMAVFGLANWFLWARKHFEGPRVDAEHIQTVDVVMQHH